MSLTGALPNRVRHVRMFYETDVADRAGERRTPDRSKVFVGGTLLLACLAAAVYAGHAVAAHRLSAVYAIAIVLALLDAAALVMASWRRVTASSYVAGLLATTTALPPTAILISVALYLTVGQPSTGPDGLPGWFAPLWGLVIAIEAWLAAAYLARPLGRADRAVPSSYRELRQRLSQLDATLLAADAAALNGDPETATALEKALEQREWIDRDVARIGPSWVWGTGYAAVWERLYRAEEALIEIAPPDAVLAGAVYDELRLTGSSIATREELLHKLRQAFAVLDPGATGYLVPPSRVTAPLRISTPSSLPGAHAHTRYEQMLVATGGVPPYRWTLQGHPPKGMLLGSTGLLTLAPEAPATASFTVRVTDAASQMVESPFTLTIEAGPPSSPAGFVPASHGAARALPARLGPSAPMTGPPDARRTARVILRTVRRSINESRNASWNGLILSRNHLLETMVLTGLTAFVLLGMAMVWAAPRTAILAASVFYLVGATVGLADRLRRESQSESAVHDYGVSVARLVTIPLFSGLGALGGVFLASVLPGFSPVSGPEAPTAALAIATAPALTDCHEVAKGCSEMLEASGGRPPYRWTVSAGALPDALALSPAGILSGTPTNEGTAQFTARVTDGSGAAAEKGFSLAIKAPTGDEKPSDLAVATTTPLPPALAGLDYSARLQAVGGAPPYTWTLASAKPGWLKISPQGVLSGRPAAAGAVVFTATVQDRGRSPKPKEFTLPVGESEPPPLEGPSSGRVPSLREIFDLGRNPLGLLVAAVFGLTPGLLFERLQNQADKYRADLKSSQATEGTPKT